MDTYREQQDRHAWMFSVAHWVKDKPATRDVLTQKAHLVLPITLIYKGEKIPGDSLDSQAKEEEQGIKKVAHAFHDSFQDSTRSRERSW
jgi:hypothetical protein